ncbi:MAG: HesB/IscA family protein [Candidatus Dormibacteria bacterium]
MITVSDSAMGHLEGLVSGEATPVGLRVYVQSGGCSGFSYGMGLDENPPRPDDEVIEAAKGLKVYVDSYSAQYLEGAEIDYVDALMGGGFTIHNPNAAKTCGCGHSFQTADGAGQAQSCSA